VYVFAHGVPFGNADPALRMATRSVDVFRLTPLPVIASRYPPSGRRIITGSCAPVSPVMRPGAG
jgi:hypothetical protein